MADLLGNEAVKVDRGCVMESSLRHNLDSAKRILGQHLFVRLGVNYPKAFVVQAWRENARDLASRGRIEQALASRRKAVARDPRNIQIRMELVRELLLAGRADEAKAADAGQMQVWRMLGGELISKGHHGLGLWCWRRAVELDPTNTQMRLELIRETLSREPKHLHTLSSSADGPALRIFAQERISQGDTEFAFQCLDMAAHLDPEGILEAPAIQERSRIANFNYAFLLVILVIGLAVRDGWSLATLVQGLALVGLTGLCMLSQYKKGNVIS